jgi:hypothetical protein
VADPDGRRAARRREPRYWELVVRSPAMHLAMRSIARRTGVAAGYVLLAAYAVALARCTGRSPVVTQLVVSNRFRPGCRAWTRSWRRSTPGSPSRRSWCPPRRSRRRRSARAGRPSHGYFDPSAHAEMLARVRRDHGEVDISCLVNDRRAGTGPAPSGPAPTLGQLRAAAAPTTTRWGRKLDVLDYKLIVSVDAAPDAVDLSILADTHCIGPGRHRGPRPGDGGGRRRGGRRRTCRDRHPPRPSRLGTGAAHQR